MKKALKGILLLGLGLITGLSLAEGLARWLLPHPQKQIALLRMRAPDLQMDADTDLRHPGYNPFIQRRPFSEWVCDGKNPERMNNEGFRDRNFVSQPQSGRWRMAIIGDSFTEGWMGPREVAFPHVVENKLGASCEVLNFGIANRSPLRYLALYEQIVRKYHPQVVVVCLYQNDTVEDAALKPYTTFDDAGVPVKFDYARYFRHTPRMPQTKWEKRRDRWQWILCQYSRLYPYAAVMSVDADFRKRVLEALPAQAQEAQWKNTAEYLHVLNKLMTQDHVRFLLAYVPDLGDFEAAHALRAQARQWAEVEKISFFGADRFLTSKDSGVLYLPGDGHFSAEGHRRYGEEMAAWVMENVR